jgi:hypothetical protein
MAKKHNHLVLCHYCTKPAEFYNSSAIVYSGKNYGPIYLCKCQTGWSYVGCHPGTTKPLGRLANRELRTWKKKAHAAFDPVWKEQTEISRTKARKLAYTALSDALGLEREDCHIGMFNVDMCKAVCEAVAEDRVQISC